MTEKLVSRKLSLACEWPGHGSSRLAGAHRNHALGRDRVIAYCKKWVPSPSTKWLSTSCYQSEAVRLREAASGYGSKKTADSSVIAHMIGAGF